MSINRPPSRAAPSSWARSGRRPSPNALAETAIGLFKTELIGRLEPWRSIQPAEIGTLESLDWFNHRHLLEPIGNIPPAEAERTITPNRKPARDCVAPERTSPRETHGVSRVRRRQGSYRTWIGLAGELFHGHMRGSSANDASPAMVRRHGIGPGVHPVAIYLGPVSGPRNQVLDFVARPGGLELPTS